MSHTKDLTPAHSKLVLQRMFSVVGAEKEFDTFDFGKEGWYHAHTWTAEEQEEFTKWLGKFLEEKKYCTGTKRRQNMGYYEASKIVGVYGWKTV
jgi:hypothetical protein